jgi:hypothetical protein
VVSRACGSLERGGESSEGASAPRVRKRITRGGALGPRARRGIARGGANPSTRRRIARGGVNPSSEADNRLRGALGPRAMRRITRGGANPSSEAENHPRGDRGRSVGGPLWFLWAVSLPALGCDHMEHVLQGSRIVPLHLLFFKNKGFPQLLGDPYGCPRQYPPSLCSGIR